MQSPEWQFQFAQWPWLWVPLLLLLLYLLSRFMRNSPLGWRFPDVLPGLGQQYYHPRYQLIRQSMRQRTAGRALLAGRLQPLLIWLFVIACCLSLAQPEWTRQHKQEPEHFRDIVFVIDTSVSMIQRDYLLQGQRIDRMTLLKGALSRFIDQLSRDRISIVVYAEKVYTLVPLTDDHELAKIMLARVHTGLAGRTSAMGSALAQAVHEAQQSGNPRRVLVLFTDATRQTGQIDIDVATEMARQAGIKVYTVAIGARTADAAEQRTSGLIYDPANIRKLEAIASHTGGKFYWADDTGALGTAISDIESTEKRQEAPRYMLLRQPLYQWPLLAALLIFTVLQFINLRLQARL